MTFADKVLQSGGLVMVYSWADWCGPCHIMAPVIDDLEETFRAKIKVYRLDVDHNRRIPREYGIRILPTLLFFRDGKIIDQVQGIVSRQVLEEEITSLFYDNEV